MPRRKGSGGYGPRRCGELLSITVVEAAVKTACLITGAEPDDVLGGVYAVARTGQNKIPRFQNITRARHYAAFALRAIYEEANWADMAALLGARQPLTYYHIQDCAIRESGLKKWWSDAAFMRVIEATEAFIEMRKHNVPAPDKGLSRAPHEANQGEPATQGE